MALKVATETLVINVSKLIKHGTKAPTLLTEELAAQLEEAVTSIIDDSSVVVETEIVKSED